MMMYGIVWLRIQRWVNYYYFMFIKDKLYEILIFFYLFLFLQEDDFVDWIKWFNVDYVKNFKKKKREFGDYFSFDDCILEMVNY